MGKGLTGLLFGGILGASGGIVVGIIIGALLFAGFGLFQTGGSSIPYDANHVKLAGLVSAVDTTTHAPFTCRHVFTTSTEFYPSASYDVFTPHHTYTESLWIFTAGSDIDITMVIWGPGDDNETYSFGFGRHMWNGATISGFGQTIVWTEGGAVTAAEAGFTTKMHSP